jgi:hypothetical protein
MPQFLVMSPAITRHADQIWPCSKKNKNIVFEEIVGDVLKCALLVQMLPLCAVFLQKKMFGLDEIFRWGKSREIVFQ